MASGLEQGSTITEDHHDELSGMSNTQRGHVSFRVTAETDTLSSSKSVHGKTLTHWVLLFASSMAILLGHSISSLLGRIYFVHGGSRRWLYTWNQSCAWPIMLIPLLICYRQKSVNPTPMSLKLVIVYCLMGVILAGGNLTFSWSISYLPVSTMTLLLSSQLAFTALFAFTFLKKRVTAYSLNAVFVITISAVLLGAHANSDRPAGTTNAQYIMGFIVTIISSASWAVYLILAEFIYKNMLGKANFVVSLEVQTWISAAATLFTMIGMWAAGDFTAIRHEAKEFDIGIAKYILVLVWSAIGWQLFFLGSAAIIFLTSSLMTCVFTTATFPLVPILGAIFFQEDFSALKAISMLLAMWGFTSYSYGGYLEAKERNKVVQDRQVETQTATTITTIVIA